MYSLIHIAYIDTKIVTDLPLQDNEALLFKDAIILYFEFGKNLYSKTHFSALFSCANAKVTNTKN